VVVLTFFGNLTGWGSGQDAVQASWDALSQMRSLQGLGVNRRFAYDANGERILVREVNFSPVVYTLTLRDPGGKVLREVTYTPSTGSWAWRKDHVWRGRHSVGEPAARRLEGLPCQHPSTELLIS
jgi:hypothetical protein